MSRRKALPPPAPAIELPATWPDGSPRSQRNAFTAYLTEPRSQHKYTPKGSPTRQSGARFGDIEKSAIYDLRGATA